MASITTTMRLVKRLAVAGVLVLGVSGPVEAAPRVEAAPAEKSADAPPACADGGGDEAYMNKTGRVCRLD